MSEGNKQIEAFIDRWGKVSGKERTYYQVFLNELCDLIGVEKPGAEGGDDYCYERTVTARRIEGPEPSNFIDLYKRDCFVLEAKQSRKRERLAMEARQLSLGVGEQTGQQGRRGSGQWDTLMRNAREQAERYAKSLPSEEGWPPFLVIVDVGHVIELYADFSLQGKHYAQFPDRQSFRIYLEDLRDETVRERLHHVWTDPQVLNPARRTAEVTREIAELLAKLSKSLETRMIRALPDKQRPGDLIGDKRDIAGKVALFLMRCLFTMFAEDVGLLKRDCFTKLLKDYKGRADKLHFALQHLWQAMNQGGYSTELMEDVARFNGGLFKNSTALKITEEDLDLLTIAAIRDWKDVEPAIFGTLLENALDPGERHKLGAHYTPRVYVERLVVETVIEPLRADWRDVQAAAAQLAEAGKAAEARKLVKDFHRTLCETRVLDPACGTGNFLYVSLELMKRLEGEVIEALADLGVTQANLELDRHTVDPHQFLGLEINPRAVAIAELVLWIGYLQWHFRTRGKTMPAEPVLKNFANIREQDAIIQYDKWDVLRDESGRPVTRWDGVTYKLHPITGEEIPDEEARTELRTYLNPRPATWPQADFIVGNPPFIGGKDMRRELGDGYAEACWSCRNHIPGGADFVMHFWDKAAETVRAKKARRFGLITTNSVTQKFSRRVIEHHLNARKPLSLAMAIPDHPWMKSADKSAVRIAMTVGVAGAKSGALKLVIGESDLNSDSPGVTLKERRGKVAPDLRIGADVTSSKPLRANEKLCSPGVKLHGAGFIVTPQEAAGLGLGKVPGLDEHILHYRNGRDLAARPRGVMVIDLFPLTESEVLDSFPAVYQWVADRVKPEREQNRERFRREYWWWFGRRHTDLRHFLKGLPRYIATVETSKHRFFQFLDASIRPDNKLVNIGIDDAFHLGVLSSRIHVAWALAAGGRLGVGNDPVYVKTSCFDPFPLPEPPEELRTRIRSLGERLDAHRKKVLEDHKQLTMTGLYNVMEKVRTGETLSEAEKDVYDAGLVGVLRRIHDDLDKAVAEAYGWSFDLSDEGILERLVALNHERAEEEKKSKVRWLRPEFQAPKEVEKAAPKAEQLMADLVVAEKGVKKTSLPRALPEQVAAIRAVLEKQEAPITALDLARYFRQGKKVEKKVEELLSTLALLGQAVKINDCYILSE
ncbi:MAG: class I SAM-dependent DNA methyltransferase [Candidatus Glassbacteria bacterium]|nr:class I SAM-dependent DNA methyltransferase [Candidatus Glassbacteria bacterium]